MPPTLADLLPLLEPHFDTALVSAAARAKINASVQRLPLISGGGFECPLGPLEGPVGVAARLTKQEGGLSFLSELDACAADTNVERRAWNAVRDLARACQSGGSDLVDAVDEVWLEFDLAEHDHAAPGLFFKLQSYYARPPSMGAHTVSRTQSSVTVVQEGLRALGVELDAAGQAELHRCFTAIPACSTVSFVGVMLSRGAPGYRLTIGNVPLDEMTSTLHKLAWPAAREPLIPVLELLIPLGPKVTLHLDLAPAPQPKIGIEVAFSTDAKAEERSRVFHTELLNAGLLTEEKAAALARWPGSLHRAHREGVWPTALDQYNYLVRSINHLKLTFDPSAAPRLASVRRPLAVLAAAGILSAKAYLAFNQDSIFPHLRIWRTSPNG